MNFDGSTSRADPGAAEAALAARVRELERQIAMRDEQLEVRAGVIRRLRRELAEARDSYERAIHSRPYRMVSFVRRAALTIRPRQFARAVRRRTQGTAVTRSPRP
jgi:hypothetical protein